MASLLKMFLVTLALTGLALTRAVNDGISGTPTNLTSSGKLTSKLEKISL